MNYMRVALVDDRIHQNLNGTLSQRTPKEVAIELLDTQVEGSVKRGSCFHPSCGTNCFHTEDVAPFQMKVGQRISAIPGFPDLFSGDDVGNVFFSFKKCGFCTIFVF